MPRLSFSEALQKPFPEGGSIPDLVHELILHMEVPCAHGGALVNAFGGDDKDVESIKSLKESQVHYVLGFLGDELLVRTIYGIKVLLGTMMNPFTFAPESIANSTSKTKGGETQNVGGILTERRRMPASYFPPAEFDVHRKGSKDRDECAIRKLIPKEVSCALRGVVVVWSTSSHSCDDCPIHSPLCADAEDGWRSLPYSLGEVPDFYRHRATLWGPPQQKWTCCTLGRLEGFQWQEAQGLRGRCCGEGSAGT